jgi:hypothetical protein
MQTLIPALRSARAQTSWYSRNTLMIGTQRPNRDMRDMMKVVSTSRPQPNIITKSIPDRPDLGSLSRLCEF